MIMRRSVFGILVLSAWLATPGPAHAQQATSLDRCVSAITADVLRFLDKGGKCVRQCEDAKRRGTLGSDTKCRRPSNHAPTQACLSRAVEQIAGSKSLALKRCRDDEVALFYGGTETCPGKNDSTAELLQCLAKRAEKAVETLAKKVYAPRRTPVCGDGSINGGEQCDPNAFPSGCFYPTPVCRPGSCTCAPVGCGNGVLEPGEDCEYSTYPNGCRFNQFCGFDCSCEGGSASAAFLSDPRDLFE
jgi:hypothetical protein